MEYILGVLSAPFRACRSIIFANSDWPDILASARRFPGRSPWQTSSTVVVFPTGPSRPDFYKRFQQKQQQSGYLIDQAVTSVTGNFAFPDAPPGTHYVLVKFPALIDGYKVAWQELVTVTTGRIGVVTLDEENLALPKNRRR